MDTLKTHDHDGRLQRFPRHSPQGMRQFHNRVRWLVDHGADPASAREIADIETFGFTDDLVEDSELSAATSPQAMNGVTD
ncbi:MAG: hypothetical protein KC442_19700 [Thermomicrobiales bacterium]|nr:hypothetical protein [Thermomicrobiales bacterium]